MALLFNEDAFASLTKDVAQRMTDKAEWVWEHRKEVRHVGLREDLNPYFYRRVGDYRLIYTYDSDLDEIVVHLGGHRRDIYYEASNLP